MAQKRIFLSQPAGCTPPRPAKTDRAMQVNRAPRYPVFIEGDRMVILTNGFQKKTQKTPKREIELAEARKREHQSREKTKNG
jgi:hypothetical protein